MPFDRTTGKPLQNFEGEDYSVLTGELLLNKMKKDIETDLISVIVPIFNVEAYLRPCIESILASTYTTLKII